MSEDADPADEPSEHGGWIALAELPENIQTLLAGDHEQREEGMLLVSEYIRRTGQGSEPKTEQEP